MAPCTCPYLSLQTAPDFPTNCSTQGSHPCPSPQVAGSPSIHTQLSSCFLPEPSLACPPEGTWGQGWPRRLFTLITALETHSTSAGVRAKVRGLVAFPGDVAHEEEAALPLEELGGRRSPPRCPH